MPAYYVHQSTENLFAPDTLLPAQYFDRIRRRKDLTGEQRLMIAVLELAVDDYIKYVHVRERARQGVFAEAEAWFDSADRSWLYAFETICDHIGLDAGYVRRGLRRWKSRVLGEDVSPVPVADVLPAAERPRASNE